MRDQMKHSKPSTLRRTLNALRQRLTKRNRTKPPDWFVERFSNATKIDKTSTTATNSNNNDASATNSIAPDTQHDIRCSSLLCNRLSVNPTLQSHYRWLAAVSLAVLYNIIFVVGRAVFWEINNKAAILWYFLDYWCDFIYLIDILMHKRKYDVKTLCMYIYITLPQKYDSLITHRLCQFQICDVGKQEDLQEI
uniref:Ion transport domain-containing protein n=1 Tax=Glossina austeni TaxID=7395 RepID=A0A1A9VU28_GLOAU